MKKNTFIKILLALLLWAGPNSGFGPMPNFSAKLLGSRNQSATAQLLGGAVL